MAGENFDELSQLWEEEGLFSRDIDGQLVRLEDASEQDYEKDITLKIDGQEVTVKRAQPTLDSQGNVVRDESGKTIPRDTTIYDATQKLYVDSELGKVNPIPTLCHREHMRPVAICRVCCVEVYKEDRSGNLRSGGKLIPACHQPVKHGMIVHTIATPEKEKSERLKRSVKLLTELLTSDHLDTSAPSKSPSELAALAGTMDCQTDRFSFRPAPPKKIDDSSRLIAIDHSACILCERCVRGCNEIKQNEIIGRSGKGYESSIGFDLNVPMEESNCVSCGECMVSCPTDALTFKNPVESAWHKEAVAKPDGFNVTAEDLRRHPLFNSIPYKWLQWNQASIIRRTLKAGEVLCHAGEYGSTAYILVSGEFGVHLPQANAKNGVAPSSSKKSSALGNLLRSFRGRASTKPVRPPTPPTPSGKPQHILTPDDLILGEMTCMNFQPRSATVVAQTDCETFEIRRNVLFMLQRSESSRAALDKRYRERTLINQVNSIELFSDLTDDERADCVTFLKDRVQLLRVEPGQAIYAEGEPADDIYLLRLGHVKVSQSTAGQDRVLTYIRPDTPRSFFGEIGVLTAVNEKYRLDQPDVYHGSRSATCSALDDVELVRIKRNDFMALIDRHESLKDKFVALAKSRLVSDIETKQDVSTPVASFLDQGLFNAQKLLVLDLEACTRCDECVKACADTHDGVTRLVREGLRFDKFLVASACRSCTDPYCMVGCPVDSIHREGSLEIKIEDHCIGCGLCAKNCPYGNINMVEFDEAGSPYQPGMETAVVANQATTCDLCKSVGVDASNPRDEVSCVYACPHNAAFRMTGQELLDQIE
ncbi:cyclic nucleotide-binding domain-containing protein [Mariniblastus sp.]|nr:cyclic nucleotide-binding domain-containing protein [Mariniblastus sp.]